MKQHCAALLLENQDHRSFRYLYVYCWDVRKFFLFCFNKYFWHIAYQNWTPLGHPTAASLPGWDAEKGEERMVSVWPQHMVWTRGHHSKIRWFQCSLTAHLCLVKSMNVLQLISGVAAISCMVSSINCFSTHLILSTLTAWSKSMAQFRYLKWVMFSSILMNWGFNECC